MFRADCPPRSDDIEQIDVSSVIGGPAVLMLSMLRSILPIVAMIATPALAIAAPPSGNGFGKPGAGDATMDRTTFLAVGGSVTIALTAGDTFELVRTGKPNNTIRGFGVIAAFPVMLWGMEHIAQDHGDAASWAITVASTGLVAYGVLPVIDRFVLGYEMNDDSSNEPALPMPQHRIRAAPIAIAGPHSTGPGLGLVATF